MPLTDVFDSTGFTDLNNKIDAMTPAGNTNTTIGLVWGWHSLTSNLPLTQGATPAPDLDKVIIMLTDGDNTEDRWSTTGSQIDARMQMACDNVKAANIKIYTVRVINGNADPAAEAAPPTRTCITTCSRRASSTACSRRSRRTLASLRISEVARGTAHGRSARSFAAKASIRSL